MRKNLYKKRQTKFLVICLIIVASLLLVIFNPFSKNKVDMAVNYLRSHFNQTVGLTFESEDTSIKLMGKLNYTHNQIYWIYSDNLIATWALKPYDPQISAMINQTIQSYNLSQSDFFEVLFGKPIPMNPLIAVQRIIEQHPDRVIMAEFHNSSKALLWEEYGDTLIYQSLNLYIRGNRTGAEHYFYQAYNMWDRKEIYDLSTNNDKEGNYANYKLALILYASKILDLTITNYTQIEDKLWSMQQLNGGITSLTDYNGNPIGSANAETTALTLLPYNDELISRMKNFFVE